MWEIINETSTYLDNLTGIRGTLGHICIVLIIMVGHIWSNRAPPTSEPTGPKKESEKDEEPEDPPRNFTMKQLAYFDGTKDGDEDKPVYLSLNGTVFDVSEGRDFYGPGGPYELFAGHECGIALAKMSFDAAFLDNFDDIPNLKHGERMELDNWIEKFTHYRCYPIKGRVIPVLPPSDRILTKEDLAHCTGSQDIPPNYGASPIYIGAGDKVFDVSFGGIGFYGPGCSYNRFAGLDASRALAKMSFEPEDTQNSNVDDLTDKQRKILDDWIKTFEVRKGYPIVGRLGKSL